MSATTCLLYRRNARGALKYRTRRWPVTPDRSKAYMFGSGNWRTGLQRFHASATTPPVRRTHKIGDGLYPLQWGWPRFLRFVPALFSLDAHLELTASAMRASTGITTKSPHGEKAQMEKRAFICNAGCTAAGMSSRAVAGSRTHLLTKCTEEDAVHPRAVRNRLEKQNDSKLG